MAAAEDGGQISDLKSLERLSAQLNAQIIGADRLIDTPFGKRRLVYADYTASGRALAPIEDYIRQEVLPVYGNVHSQSTWTARQSGYFREEAREIARNYFRGSHENAIIFTGSGATGAITTFMSIMARQRWREQPKPELRETRWRTFICDLCDGLQLDGESAVKAHLNSHEHLSRRETTVCAEEKVRLVIFLVDPTLHHSSLLPFRELAKTSSDENSALRFKYEILDTIDTAVNMESLSAKLDAIKTARDVWGEDVAVSVWCILNGCSNITGCKASVSDLSRLVHEYDCCHVAFDLASALGSVPVRLNAPGDLGGGDFIDAAFFSPHKLLGGPDTAGILALRKNFLSVDVAPGVAGGGVVRFVSRELQLYNLEKEQREEAGTPNIVACIRTGMVLKLASTIPPHLSMAREGEHMRMCLQFWSRNKRIQILGPVTVVESQMGCSSEDLRTGMERVERDYYGVRKSVVSLMIKYGNNLQAPTSHGSGGDMAKSSVSVSEPVNGGLSLCSYRNRSEHTGGLYLHHNFVCAVLNDVFGIQARPGCACAGPLSHELLGMSQSLVGEYMRCLEETGLEVMRPGFCRISLHFAMTIDEVELIAQAVNWVAQFGWKLLPYYTFSADTGEWTQNVVKPDRFRKWLSHLSVTPAAGALWGSAPSRDRPTAEAESLGGGAKKDPKKLAGAVAMPGMSQEAIVAMKAALAKRSAGSKRSQGEEKSGSAPRRKNSVEDTPGKTKSVAEIRSMLEKKATAASQNPTGVEKLRSVKALASKFERSASLKSQSVLDSPCVPSPEVHRRPSLKSGGSSDHSSAKPAVKPPVLSAPAAEEILAHVSCPPSSAQSSNVPEPAAETPDDAVENCVVREIDDARRAVHRAAQRETPLELQEFYDRANELIDGLRAGSGSAATLARLSRQGLCPPLPREFAHLLWFALPGDAIYSIGVFGPMPNEGEPAVCTRPTDPGYPAWTVSTGSSLAKPRALHAAFELRAYPAAVGKKNGPVRRGNAAAAGDALLAWINESAERALAARLTVCAAPAASSASCGAPSSEEEVENRRETRREATSAVIESSSCQCNSLAAEVGSVEQPSPVSLLRSVDSAYTASSGSSGSAGPSLGPGNALQPAVPRALRRKLGDALMRFSMVTEGDRILVGLSGGKDSLTMLHLLLDLQRRSPVKFALAAATVNPQTLEYDPSPLIPYLEELGVTYHMLSYPIMAWAAESMQGDSLCAFCARMKRGLLYSCMRANGYNKLALGQHMDDVAESFLMSAFYNGTLNTMKANYRTVVRPHALYAPEADGQCSIHIIRPLVFVREKELAQFAQHNHLPVIADNCPACFKAPKERLRMKHLLAAQEFEHPATLHNIKKAVMPLLAISQAEKPSNLWPTGADGVTPEDEEEDCAGLCARRRS